MGCSGSNDNSSGGAGGTAGIGGTAGSGGTGGAGEISYPLLDCDSLVPEFCGYPFPSNVYTQPDGSTVTGRRVSFGEQFMMGNAATPWDKSDGFSAGSPILAYLPGATGDEFGGTLAGRRTVHRCDSATRDRRRHPGALPSVSQFVAFTGG